MKLTTKDLTNGNITRNFLLLSIPLVLSSLLSQAFGMVDMMVAGRFLGEEGLAATGATSSFDTLFNAIFWGFFNGTSVYSAKLFGAKRYKDLRTLLRNVGLFVAVAALLCSGVFVLLRAPLFLFLKIDPLIYQDAMDYFLIVMSGKVAMFLNGFFLYTLTALGNSVLPFWVSLFSSLVNLGGNVFTVTVLNWGVAGLAVSTVFSNLLVAVVYFAVVKKCISELPGGKEKLKWQIDLSLIGQTMRYGMPTATQQMIMYLCTFGLAPLINGIGVSATAGYSVVQRAYGICSSFYYSSARTVSSFVGQCLGAGKFDKIRQGMRSGFVQGVAYMLIPLIPLVLFPTQICGLFFEEGFTGEALDTAVRFCRVFLPFVVFGFLTNLFHAFYRGFGAIKMLLASTAVGAVVRLICSYLLVPEMRMDGIYLGWVIAWIAEAAFAAAIYFLCYRSMQMLQKHCRAD